MKVVINVHDEKAWDLFGMPKNCVTFWVNGILTVRNFTSYEDAATVGMLSSDVFTDQGHDVVLNYMW